MKALVVVFLLMVAPFGFAAKKKIDTTEYSSAVDDELTIRNVTFLPSHDNIRGIYAKSIDKRLKRRIEQNHHWEYVPTKLENSKLKPEDLVGQPKKVMAFAKNFGADAFFTAETRKDPKGLEVTLFLFSARSGRLIAEERVKQVAQNTDAVLATVDKMVDLIRERVPYDGVILSRTDNRVTINLGKTDGVRVGHHLPVLKIVGAERHPKRDFVIKTHKVLLGQIRVVKIDKYISFADISSEKEPGVVAKGVKVSGVTAVHYKQTPWTNNYTPPEVLLSENNKVVYGKKPKEWIPTNPPTFGKVGARISLGTFNNNLSLTDGTNYDSQVDVYPKVDLDAELWLTPAWYVQGVLGQGVAASRNPNGAASPDQLNQSLTHYRLSIGYNFLLQNKFFGPKFSFDIGVASYRMFIDNSTPTSFTTLDYESFPFGVSGFVPVTRNKKWGIGGSVYFHMFPSLRESPVNSGSSSENTINQVMFYAVNKFSERLRLKFGVEAIILSTTFDGPGSRTDSPGKNLSQRHMMLLTGADYMF